MNQSVILLHGLARSSLAMKFLQWRLSQHYKVVNHSYPSQKYDIQTLAEMAIAPAVDKLQDYDKIHFVTHSLGGILVRQYLSQHSIDKLGYTVMLGPPNQGSEVADFFHQFSIFARVNGPAGQQLGTQQNSLPVHLGAVNFPVGVIAGSRSTNPLFSKLIGSSNDGKVSVASSKVDGMIDHIVLPVTHTFMMNNPAVAQQILHFLDHGHFTKPTL